MKQTIDHITLIASHCKYNYETFLPQMHTAAARYAQPSLPQNNDPQAAVHYFARWQPTA